MTFRPTPSFFETAKSIVSADYRAEALARANATISRAFTGVYGPHRPAPVADPAPTMSSMESACRYTLTRSDIPADERAFVQGLVDRADAGLASGSPTGSPASLATIGGSADTINSAFGEVA